MVYACSSASMRCGGVSRVGFLSFLKFWEKKRKITVLMVYPNKDVSISEVEFASRQFTKEAMTYTIDEKAIYYYKGKPTLFYYSEVSSPIGFNREGSWDYSLSASEINSVLETKAVRDLLLAAMGEDGKLFWICVASAALSLITLLIVAGVIKVGVATLIPK
jgi:hypothetical protein